MTCPELKVCEKCGGKGFIPTGERWGPNLVWVKRCMDCCKHNGGTWVQSENHPQPGAVTCSLCGKVMEEDKR
jgi:hypothetical protein